MRPLRSISVLRIDPAHQPLWRDDDTLQFGIDRRAEITLTEPWHGPLVDELRRGIRRESFDVIAHGLGAPRAEARELLKQLNPVIHVAPLLPPPLRIQAEDSDDAPAVMWMAENLAHAGFRIVDDAPLTAVSVRIVRGAAVAAQFAADLAADRPHLPIAFDAGGASIGPLVAPGRTPCLSCRDLQLADADPAWPRLHAQLIGRAGGRISASRVALAAPLVTELLREANPGSRVVRVSADGQRHRHPVAFHEGCLCRAVSPGSQPENETASAPWIRKPAPTTPTACAQPA